jgi:serine/threonine protein kinase
LGDTYLLARRVSRGGMGEVFEATHARLPGRYAVKILLPELVGNREAFARFCREAEVMSELRHPGFVQIFDFNTTPDGRPYFVMEYLEGRDLESRLVTSGPMQLPAAVRVIEAAASALATAHAHGIIHRDLKPANIFLVTVDGQTDELVKVLDFGISKLRSEGTLLATPTDVLGTPPYMAPEQARGATDQIDHRTDQFALGAIAYRMLTGHEPFRGEEIASLLYQVVHEAPPPISLYVPPAWDTRPLQMVLDRALAKDRDQRWGGVMEFARAFELAAEQTLPRATVGRPLNLGATWLGAPPPPPPTPEDDDLRAEPAETLPPVRTGASIPPGIPPGMTVEDSEPPIRTPMPTLTPRQPAPRELEPSRSRAREIDFEPRPRWEDAGASDRIPFTHRRLLIGSVVLLVLAVAGIVTGLYRRIPAAVPAVKHELGLGPRAASPSPVPPATSSAPASPQTAAPPPPQAPAHPPAARQPGEIPRPPAPAEAEPQRHAAVHHHHHRVGGAAQPFEHPGSVELAPEPTPPVQAPTTSAATLPPPVSVPPAASATSPAPVATPPTSPGPFAIPSPAPSNFAIPPPAPTVDSPSHDLAPAPEPESPHPGRAAGDQPLPPSVP